MIDSQTHDVQLRVRRIFYVWGASAAHELQAQTGVARVDNNSGMYTGTNVCIHVFVYVYMYTYKHTHNICVYVAYPTICADKALSELVTVGAVYRRMVMWIHAHVYVYIHMRVYVGISHTATQAGMERAGDSSRMYVYIYTHTCL
jgi:hypothetical protein